MAPQTPRQRLADMLADLERSIEVLQNDRYTVGAGTTLADADQAEAALDTMLRQRDEVTGALSRTEAGTYGRCVDCAASVPEGRLEARPEAARCVPCQAARDHARR